MGPRVAACRILSPLLLLLALAALMAPAGAQALATRCTPGEAFVTEDLCGVCVCGQEGDRRTAFCTRRRCLNDVMGPADEDMEVCRPGQVFRRECNYCVCPGSGIRSRANCTTRVCHPPSAAAAVLRRFRRAPGNGERCAPNIRYMDDCNLCICSADGIKAHSSCTFAQCPGKPR